MTSNQRNLAPDLACIGGHYTTMAYDRAEDYMANSSQLHASHDDSEDLTINASQFKQTQVQYATINGYRIGKCIGAGGFSKSVCWPASAGVLYAHTDRSPGSSKPSTPRLLVRARSQHAR